MIALPFGVHEQGLFYQTSMSNPRRILPGTEPQAEIVE